jgi:TldD protein
LILTNTHILKRKDFLQMTSLGLGALLLPGVSTFGNILDEKQFLQEGMDVATKKQLADVALNTARKRGSTYADVRIGRYLTQVIQTRENRVLGVSNNQSYGVGVRVIANGTWGFAATNEVTADAIAQCAEQAVLIAKANSKLQQQPIKLAPQKGLGEVSWKTPIKKNAFEIPVSQKTDLLLQVNAGALAAGASFVNSGLDFVNEQKYYANTEGTYAEQDIHRLNPSFTVTVVNKGTGKFKTRNQLCAPMGMGYEYLDGLASEKGAGPNGLVL